MKWQVIVTRAHHCNYNPQEIEIRSDQPLDSLYDDQHLRLRKIKPPVSLFMIVIVLSTIVCLNRVDQLK